MSLIPRAIGVLGATIAVAAAPVVEARTRAVYLGPEGRILTGRTMDWKLPIVSNLWVFPRGIARKAPRASGRANGHRSTAALRCPAITFPLQTA